MEMSAKDYILCTWVKLIFAANRKRLTFVIKVASETSKFVRFDGIVTAKEQLEWHWLNK